jgi:hypothetical protein
MPREDGFKMNVADRTVEIVRALGEIDMDNLTREVQDAGGHSVWWAVLAAEQDAKIEHTRLALKTAEAEKAQKYRVEKSRLSEKVTEAMVQEHLTLDGVLVDLREVMIDEEKKSAILHAVSSAVNQKARTLQNLSFLIGQEHGANREALRDRVKDGIAKERRSERTPV